MAVKYVVIPKANPQDRTVPAKFYAQAKSSGELTFRKEIKPDNRMMWFGNNTPMKHHG